MWLLQSEGSGQLALPALPSTVKVSLLKVVKRNGGLQYERQAVNLMGKVGLYVYFSILK